MMGPGPLIAIDVIFLYVILGPLVLFAIYVLFDSLSKPIEKLQEQANVEKDPALWTNEDIKAHMNRL
jgi:hypothetical protein